jgi:predicted metal-binding membrane protein
MITQANDKLDPKLGRSRSAVIAVLGASQTLAWASSYYLPAIAAFALVAGVAGTLFIHRTVIVLINRISSAMTDLAKGNLNAEFSEA